MRCCFPEISSPHRRTRHLRLGHGRDSTGCVTVPPEMTGLVDPGTVDREGRRRVLCRHVADSSSETPDAPWDRLVSSDRQCVAR